MRIAVFCGASTGHDPVYLDAARATGRVLAEEGVELVFGGGRIGLMGAIADATLQAGGVAIGVMPRALIDREIAHTGLTTLHVVDDMHERKAKMAELADGFLTLPGGAGTLEEIVEQWTWSQIGLHRKPCAFLDVKGYYARFREMVEHMAAEGFISPVYTAALRFSTDPRELLQAFRDYRAPADKWNEPSAFVGRT